ncbi:unnamed protein product [Camellia sinensis]
MLEVTPGLHSLQEKSAEGDVVMPHSGGELLNVLSNGESVDLVFECLDLDLKKFINSYPEIAKDPHMIKVGRFMHQILRGVAYCHAHEILHRDLKPRNLLINRNNKMVKLADFGLARTFDVPLRTYTGNDCSTEAASVGWRGVVDQSGMSASQGNSLRWEWHKDPRLDCLGFRGIFPSNTIPPLVEADKETDEKNYLLWRLEKGVAEGSTEIPKDFKWEIGQDLVRTSKINGMIIIWPMIGLVDETDLAQVQFFYQTPSMAHARYGDLVTGRLLQTRAFPLPITAIVVDPIEMKLFSGGIDY